MDPAIATGERANVPPSAWRYHMSVDDVFESLFQAWGPGPDPSSDDLISFVTSLHASYDCNVDFYVFERGDVDGRRTSLAKVPDHVCNQIQSRPWLRVGPHAESYETPPYEQTPIEQTATFESIYGHIDRMAGHQSRSRWVRLHYFSECYEIADYLRQQGVDSLLLTDRDAIAYRLDPASCRRLQRTGMVLHHGLTLRRSFPRVETIAAEGWDDALIESTLKERLMHHGYVALFTHEVDLKRAEVRTTLSRCLETLKRLGARSQ